MPFVIGPRKQKTTRPHSSELCNDCGKINHACASPGRYAFLSFGFVFCSNGVKKNVSESALKEVREPEFIECVKQLQSL